MVLIERFRNAVEELFKTCPVAFPRWRMMILCKECLYCFELWDGEVSIAGVKRLERLEHLEWWGTDVGRIPRYGFLLYPVEKDVMERPLFRRR